MLIFTKFSVLLVLTMISTELETMSVAIIFPIHQRKDPARKQTPEGYSEEAPTADSQLCVITALEIVMCLSVTGGSYQASETAHAVYQEVP